MKAGQKRRFYIITAVILAAIFLVAGGIVVYIDDQYVNVQITGTPNASFVLAYDSSNVTLPVSQGATIAVLPHANVTITAVLGPSYTVSRWDVTGAGFHLDGSDEIDFLAGPGGSTIRISAELANQSAGAG